uniref:Uncharacterized protein n=1 Tax=Rhizophora mucronata TaxID=61149 RepID=A0A2P2PSC8_RHIMU
MQVFVSRCSIPLFQGNTSRMDCSSCVLEL